MAANPVNENTVLSVDAEEAREPSYKEISQNCLIDWLVTTIFYEVILLDTCSYITFIYFFGLFCFLLSFNFQLEVIK